MNLSFYKKMFALLLTVSLCLGISHHAKAQIDENHFVYIQSENKKAFYVLLNDKLYSSSSIGYLIIPKLKDGTYPITLGFPKNQGPEQKFTIRVKGNDIGFSLKAIDKDNYTLTDLQTQETLVASNKTLAETGATPAETTATPKETSSPKVPEDNAPVAVKDNTPASFGDLMSSVTNDPTLNTPTNNKRTTDPFQETKIVRVQQAQPKEQEPATRNKPNVPDNTATDEKPSKSPIEKPLGTPSDTYGVLPIENKLVKGGREMRFVLLNNSSTDSVKIFIPINNHTSPTPTVVNDVEPSTDKPKRKKNISFFDYEDLAKDDTEETKPSKQNNQQQSSQVFINTHEPIIVTKKKTVNNPFYKEEKNEEKTEKEPIQQEVVEPAPTQENIVVEEEVTVTCKEPTLSERVFNRMRNKMISQENDTDMIATAKNMLGSRCISTAQVQTLSGLFITDNGRLAFFKNMYPQVSDKENFPSLESRIYDKKKKADFRNLIK